MNYTSKSMAKDLLLDRTVEVELFYTDTRWPNLVIEGKVDTGADSCSIDASLADHLSWEVVRHKVIKNAMGRERRPVYRGVVTIRGVEFHMEATGADRSELSHALLVGHMVIKDLILLEEE